MKKITIIAPSSFGYIDFLIEKLRSEFNVEVTHINYSDFRYTYKSVNDKLKNSLRKVFLKKNIKASYVSERILEVFLSLEKQDVVVVIRPDKIEKKTLLTLRDFTNKFYSFYFDAIANFPKKIELIPIFDRVFSYEKDDVEKYGLEFITNYIYDDIGNGKKDISIKNTIFNISSYDSRFKELKKIAFYLKENEIDYKIIVRKEKRISDNLIDITSSYLSLKEVKKNILETKVLLDIQKQNQNGLSFRVFEALAYEKKLITTNVDIVNYDFYNAKNILVIDINNIQIPETFLNSAYESVPEHILYPYTLDGWIKKVFSF